MLLLVRRTSASTPIPIPTPTTKAQCISSVSPWIFSHVRFVRVPESRETELMLNHCLPDYV